MTTESFVGGTRFNKESKEFLRFKKRKWSADKSAHTTPHPYEHGEPTVQSELAEMEDTQEVYDVAYKSGTEIISFGPDLPRDVGFGALAALVESDPDFKMPVTDPVSEETILIQQELDHEDFSSYLDENGMHLTDPRKYRL